MQRTNGMEETRCGTQSPDEILSHCGIVLTFNKAIRENLNGFVSVTATRQIDFLGQTEKDEIILREQNLTW